MLTAVGLHSLVSGYRQTAEDLSRQATLIAELRDDIVADAVVSAQRGGPGELDRRQVIAQQFQQGIDTSDSAGSRTYMTGALSMWQSLQREFAAVDPEAPLTVRAGAVGGLVASRTPGILATLDAAGAAERAQKSADLEHIGQVEHLAYLGLLAMCLLAAGVIVRLRRRLVVEVIRPVSSLRAAARELAEGRLTHRAEVTGDGEIGDLAVSFNAMASAIDGSQRSLTHQAQHDSLTGLLNRAGFGRHAMEALSRRESAAGRQALLFIDLDNFKDVNDVLGHGAGDLVLCSVAERLRQLVRPVDVVARIGGDEFAVMLDGLQDEEHARDIAQRVVDEMALPVEVLDQRVQVGASVGVAMRAGDEDLEPLMRRADVAMYQAKGKGKSRVEVYDATVYSAVADHIELRHDLGFAVERGELVLEYQPLLDLTSGELVGLEALVRWQHPTRGLLPPSTFIGLAETTRDILLIGNWVLLSAAAQMRSWQRRYGRDDLTLAVNVSVCQLESPGFAELVDRLLQMCCLPPSSLVIEVTESVLVDGSGAAAQALTRLHETGVRIALDDFGTGYSSIGYLQRLPVDILKIDRSYVCDQSGHGMELLEGLVVLGRHLGLNVIAEGIEREEDLARLQALGCSTGQGFLLCHPVPVGEIERWLATGATASAVELAWGFWPVVPVTAPSPREVSAPSTTAGTRSA